MATLSYRNINKIYDNNVQAVFDFNLEVADKEFIVFVGPSGCGKSTTLRMTAGLEHITSGELYIDDVLINNVESKDRDIAMVFQNYALYPHMTVARNMAFALEIKKMPKDEINKRVEEAAKILGLTEYLQRKPKALSGGQRQRVALGRAIVRKPKVFLMDEPLSNLDAKLRVLMRTEIKRIHEQVGATTIYVTHDQTEAMTMADRIVVMKDGYVQQIGTPTEVYNNPANVFVAGFIGSPSMNFINCTLEGETVKIEGPNGEKGQSLKIGKELAKKTYEAAKKEREELPELLARYEGLLTKVTEEMEKTKGKRKKKKAYDLDSLNKDIEEIKARMVELDKYLEDKKSISIVLGVRPEHIYVDEDGNNKKPSTKVKAKVDVTELLGSELVIYSYLLGQKVIAKTNINNSSKVTNEVEYCFDLEQIRLFSALTGEAIK